MVDGPRQRLLRSAIALMCERGVHATGLAELLEHSRSSRASIYQHFPGGKSDLMEQATITAGRHITKQLNGLLAARSPADALGDLIDGWKHTLSSSGYVAGCPILAAAECGPTEPAIRDAAAAVFASWTTDIASALVDSGADPDNARALAGLAVSSLEGAIAQSRSATSTRPLDDIRTALVPVFRYATAPFPVQ